VAEALTAYLSIADPLADETGDELDDVFGDLEVDLGGIGEVIGWDVHADGARLHLAAEEPARVIAVLVPALRKLPVASPWRLVASDPETSEELYERLFV
jgi:uncharacterized protein YuzE